MRLNELIGKNVIRTKCADTSYGLDSSYTREKMGKVLKVTENHAIYEAKNRLTEELEKRILNHYWLDDNWEDYDKLMNIEEDTHDSSDRQGKEGREEKTGEVTEGLR